MDWPLLWLTLDIIKYMSKRSGFLRAWFHSPRFRLIWSRYNPLMPSISNLIFRQRLSPLDATYHICVMEEELQILVISSTLHIKTGNLKYNCSPIFGQTNHACRNAVVFSVCILPFFAKDVRDPWLRLGLSESPSDPLGLSHGGIGPRSARLWKSELRISRGVCCCRCSFCCLNSLQISSANRYLLRMDFLSTISMIITVT